MLANQRHIRSLFADTQFRAISGVSVLVGIARWLEFLAIGIYALDETGSAFLVALLALFRLSPLALFGLFIGSLADLIDTSKLLRVGIGLMTILSVLMTMLFVFDLASYSLVAAATFISGIFWASDMSLRRKLIGDIAGSDRLGAGMAIDSAISNGTRVLGPLAGGFIYQWFGGAGIFFTMALLYFGSFYFAQSIVPLKDQAASNVSWLTQPILDAKQAFAYAISEQEILSILSITIIVNIWAFPMFSMIPVIGKAELELSASAIGIIMSLWGVAGFVGAIIIARQAKPKHFRLYYFYSVWVILVSVFAMGTMPGPLVIALGVAVAGFASAGFTTMQPTLIYQMAPLEMRGRLFGLLTICIGSGLVGLANIGFMAEHFGASNALWMVALEGVLPMVVIGFTWRRLWIRGELAE